MNRTPKRGEVWTSDAGSPFTCIDAEPDRTERYGWRSPLGHKFYKPVAGWTPPKAEPPEWLAYAVVNIHHSPYMAHVYENAAAAARMATDRLLGTAWLDLSTWVPA